MRRIQNLYVSSDYRPKIEHGTARMSPGEKMELPTFPPCANECRVLGGLAKKNRVNFPPFYPEVILLIQLGELSIVI